MPIHHPLINSNLYITVTLLFLLAVSLFFNVHHRKGFNILMAIYRPASLRDYNTPVASLQITSLIISIFALIGYSTMLLYLTGLPDVWANFGICTVVTLLFFAIKYLIIKIFFGTMYNGTEPKFLSRYHQLTVLFGVLTYIAIIILAFTIDINIQNATILALIVGLLYCASICYIFVTTFFTNITSVLALFLYLCTLEILPVMVLVKFLSTF